MGENNTPTALKGCGVTSIPLMNIPAKFELLQPYGCRDLTRLRFSGPKSDIFCVQDPLKNIPSMSELLPLYICADLAETRLATDATHPTQKHG